MQHAGKPLETSGEYHSYSPDPEKNVEEGSSEVISGSGGAYNDCVAALRSRPAAIKPIRNPRTGSLSYRVTVTIRGKQRKQQFRDLDEAKAIQEEWELERTLSASAPRPRVTRLSYEKLHQAEAADEVLDKTGFTLIDAATASASLARNLRSVCPQSSVAI